MTELLSREKEFLKLNEQLDKLATATMEQHQLQQQQQQQQQQQHTNNNTTQQQQQQQPTTTTTKADLKFLTYTKTAKGAKLEMRKRGAGDGVVVESAGDATTQGSLKERSNNNNNNNNSINSNTFRTGRSRQQQHSTATTAMATAVGNATTTGSTADDGPPPTEGRREATPTATATTTTTTLNSIAAALTQRSRQGQGQGKPQDCSSRTFSRSSTNRMPAGSTATFTVKYRNPRFVESPSLEVLVKDESASIRPRAVGSPDPESAASVTTIGPGSVVSRRSQVGARKQISTDGLIKFLKSKIAILEEDHDRISQEMTMQKELLEKTLERQKKVEQQRDQAYNKHNAISEQLAKVESQLEDATRRIKDRLLDQSAQQKDLEMVKREVKVLTQTNTNLEKRLYRANEELENTKNALALMKTAERELRETMRVESEGKDKQIKSLKKQRADLLNAYKKQLFLIDNLKRQNTCMEQSKMIGFAEKEFTKVLEWNTKT